MEEEISRVKDFLKEYNNEQIQSPTSEEIAHTRIGNYALEPEEVKGQVIDWVLNYLDNRKCPYSLALSIAKEIAQQISASLQQIETEGNAEKAFIASNVYAEAMSKISALCNAFSNQDNLESICKTKYPSSVFAIKNKRRKMEDRHVIHHDLNALLDLKDAPHQCYYAVFDGHSGIDAANYASAQLHLNIAKHPEFLTDTAKAIREGYQITDLNFLNKCNKWNIKSGCTAVSAFIRENKVYVSWLGDSQAILVRGGSPLNLTEPHKPDREDEKKRIEDLGGHVTFAGTWRVNGLLAITRAIGDPDQKVFISGDPELAIIDLDGTEDFLILACDGLWDGLSPEDVTGVLYRYLVNSSPDEPIEAVAAKLVHQSKLQGSEDNITAIVVFLRDIKDIKENAEKFLSNPMYCVQSHDFMSMNGNSDIPFSKPTVLELNATSSKKLKNAANVMSSAGFGGASYTHQYFENSVSSFHSVDSMGGDSAQNIYASKNISASCFAPEATALSELPTPPIDDILSSQQFDNFYSTDLYKELNNSMQPSQNEQLVDVKGEIESNPGTDKVDNLASVGELHPSLNEDVSLLESTTSTNPGEKISPDEAVGIASSVVSTTIETAVKCIANEIQDSVPVQSQLNPYAKPFVMKSFFSSEESSSSSISFTSSEMSAMDPTSPSMACEKETNKLDNQRIDEPVQKTSEESGISQNVENRLLENIHSADEELNLTVAGSAISDNLVQVDDLSVVDEKITEQSLNTEQIIENVDNILNNDLSNVPDSSNIFDSVAIDQISFKENISDVPDINNQEILQESNKLDNVSNLMHETLENMNVSSSLGSVNENIQEGEMNILPGSDVSNNSDLNQSVGSLITNFEKISSEFVTQSEMKISSEFVTQSEIQMRSNVTEPESKYNQNFDAKNILLDFNSEKIDLVTSDFNSKMEAIDIMSEPCMNVQKSELKYENGTIPNLAATVCKESDNLEPNQNSEVCLVSESFAEQNSLLEAEVKSKFEEIQKSFTDSDEKNESTEVSSLIEPISLISIKDELIATESEVPSDPSAEVAVDLKSLPEGIPEAEGVTEDIDSDSEKDGGWSYMKGNILSGSKSKSNEKTSKTTKANEPKSNVTTKGKRDVLKPAVDVRSRAKIDKTRSPLVDKSKNVFEKTQTTVSVDKSKSTITVDRTKTAAADKTKSLPSADKIKTLASADKIRKTPVEKKPDIKTKVMKSSTVTTTKVAADKTTRVATVSTIKKETSETAKTITSTVKSARPTTLQRTTAPVAKPSTATVTNKTVAKPKVDAASTESKTGVRNTASRTLSKITTTTQSKTTTLSARAAPVRPATTTVVKTSTMTRPPLQKPAVDSKLKQPAAAASTVTRRPMTTVAKKAEVKEVKDTVNKEILAKKKTTTAKVEPSSTLVSKRLVSANNKSNVSKMSTISKSEVSKRNVPKASALKSAKTEESKASKGVDESKNKNVDSIQCKTDDDKNSLNIESGQTIVDSAQCKTEETMNSLNMESGQKNAEEIMQVTEEKFILEVADQEKMEKEVASKEHQVIIENSSSSNPITSVAVEMPVANSTSENL